MPDKERFLAALAAAKASQSAVPGLLVSGFVEAEAVLDALDRSPVPVILMVSVTRRNLAPFVRALRGFDVPDVFVQLTGDDPVELAAAARELDVDGVFLQNGSCEAVQALTGAMAGCNGVVEVLLPWKHAAPGQRSEGRVVNIEEARRVVALDGVHVAAVPVGGGPGPYKTWRVPLWSPDAFAQVSEAASNVYYSLPWGSLLPKDLLRKYNLYGGALPGVISLPKQQFRAFIASGIVKISFRSDVALAFLCGLRESLYKRPENIDLDTHLTGAGEELAAFLRERLRDLRA